MAQLLRAVRETPSLEVSKNSGDVAPRDVISGHGGVGLGELRGISTVNDSMTL